VAPQGRGGLVPPQAITSPAETAPEQNGV
jgi:hypothetical protein